MGEANDYFTWKGFVLGMRVACHTHGIKETLDQHMANWELLGKIAEGNETLQESPFDTLKHEPASINRLVLSDKAAADAIRRFIAAQME